MDVRVFERLLLRHGALTAPSIDAMRPKLRRWVRRYVAVAREFGPTAASNLLTLYVMQAMPVRDKAKEHELRNVMPWLRPYHL